MSTFSLEQIIFRAKIEKALTQISLQFDGQLYDQISITDYLYELAQANGITSMADISVEGMTLFDITTWNKASECDENESYNFTIMKHSIEKLFKTAREKITNERRNSITRIDVEYAHLFWDCKIPPFCTKRNKLQ